MIFLAHRANLNGPEPYTENTSSQVIRALKAGFGLETDIRRTQEGTFYISHDPAPVDSDNIAEMHAHAWKMYPECEIALNVKELGYTKHLIDFININNLNKQLFLFDFELLESEPGAAAREIHELDQGIRLAARVSDRYNETIEQAAAITVSSIIWLDEFDSLWVKREHVQMLKELGRIVYAISPEIHGFTLSQAEQRWQQFQKWGVDGICTDFPFRAREVLAC